MDSNLQVPDPSAGPSRASRPVSVQPMPSQSPSSASRKRASHSVVTGHQQEEQPQYRDVYSHPAALEYAAAHPRRTIPKFGPYLLLRTLGEGEFGKVKLGLHMQWGEEVAVKLIRRGSVDSSIRMSKVEREIEVLRTLKHPNIVRLYDVIETDKYIGIILEYASGGELFDHILAHRYLREKDACKLFCQLISGVWYIHQKKIVHRDLKLENLLLDRHRNVIITDFGFANRFEHRPDDLMQTSCGSPCYAAPELVISDGAYVGSAVDVWSCGVILYAMLAGYLPFDDDPANPDGDNINLLYKYIVNTPLSFPDYISAEARDLLSIMLVPDPEHRATLQSIMSHSWLAPYAHLFERTVDELEEAAMEQHRQKRLAYQKQMRQTATATDTAASSKISRTQSAAIPNGGQHSSRNRAQPEYLYETSGDQSMYSSASPSSARRGYSSVIVPTSGPIGLEDDPFAPSPSQEVPSISVPGPQSDNVEEQGRTRKTSRASDRKVAPAIVAPVNTSPDNKRQKGGFRHTIQVEVGEPQQEPGLVQQVMEQPKAQQGSEPHRRRSSSVRAAEPPTSIPQRRESKKVVGSGEQTASKPLPAPPSGTPTKVEEPVIQVTSPPVSPPADQKSVGHGQAGTMSSSGSSSFSRGKHTRGISMDKMGIGKIFGSGGEGTVVGNGSMSRTPSQKSSPGYGTPSHNTPSTTPIGSLGSKRPSTLQPLSPVPTHTATDQALLSPDSGSSAKKSRRNTLTSIMTEQFKNPLKQRSKGKGSPADSPVRSQDKTPTPAEQEKKVVEAVVVPETPAKPEVPPKEAVPPVTSHFAPPARADVGSVPASTVKANKVMQWFRLKSKGKAPVDVISDSEQPVMVERPAVDIPGGGIAGASTSTVSHVHGGTEKSGHAVAPGHASRTPSSAIDGSFSEKPFVWGRGNGSKGTIRVHHGAVDPTMFTTGKPPEVMLHVKKVLEDMGVEIQVEGDYKYRCVRPKRRKVANGAGLGLRDTGSGLAAFTMVGSAASNGVDKRGLPVPSQSHASFGSATTGMLNRWMMRRQSSQMSNAPGPDADGVTEAALTAATAATTTDAPPSISGEPIYGSSQFDQGDEVRFSVELTRLDRLDDTYSLDVRRLKGNLRSYKFLYDTLRERADLQR